MFLPHECSPRRCGCTALTRGMSEIWGPLHRGWRTIGHCTLRYTGLARCSLGPHSNSLRRSTIWVETRPSAPQFPSTKPSSRPWLWAQATLSTKIPLRNKKYPVYRLDDLRPAEVWHLFVGLRFGHSVTLGHPLDV